MIRLLLTAVVLAVSCAPVGTSAQRFPTYQYVLQVPTKPVSPNEKLTLTWEPTLAQQTSDLYEVQLCVGLFGPWESVEALKRSSPDLKPACPPAGAIATSDTVRTSSNLGAPLAVSLMVPSARGFYDLRQISIYGSGNSMSAGAVIEVR